MRDIIDVSQLNRFAKSILAADDRMNDLIVFQRPLLFYFAR